jgi:glycosyltransferase involved in cell wall biosynthesis
MIFVIVTPQPPPEFADACFSGGIQRLSDYLAQGLCHLAANVWVLENDFLSIGFVDGQIRMNPRVRMAQGYGRLTIPVGMDIVDPIRKLGTPSQLRVILLFDNGGPYSRPTPKELYAAALQLKSLGYTISIVVPFPATEVDFYSSTREEVECFLRDVYSLMDSADIIIYPSESCRASYARRSPDECVVPYGVLCNEITRHTESERIACVSRFNRWAIHKNHFPLLEALNILRSRGWEGKADFVGPGTRSLRGVIEDMSLTDSVILHGSLREEERNAILSRAALHALPSAIEAYGFASAEALNLGIPIVACANTAAQEFGSLGVFLCRPSKGCRFSRHLDLNPDILIEPDVHELADCLKHALGYSARRDAPVCRPKSLDSAINELLSLLS